MARDMKIPVVDPALFAGKCSCGGSHPAPDIRLYSGTDAWEVLAADARAVLNGAPVMVIGDQNTHRAAGAAVAAALQAASVSVQSLTLPGDIHLTEELAQENIAKAKGVPLIIAVGAGTINDLGKYTAQHLGIPYWTVPTAPSMNGYTSSIAAVKKDGVKRTLPSTPPKMVYANPQVIRSAPLKLTQAGYCDVMAKSVSDIDWQIESALFGGSYCTLPSGIMADAEPLYAGRPERVAAGDADAVDALFLGLLISGVAMTLAGSSAPASGGEHLISHFWDMREDLTGRTPELHGLQVGAGILLSAACYEKLRGLTATDLRPAAENRFNEDASRISSIWGPLAAEVKKRFDLKRDLLLQFDDRLPAAWDRISAIIAQVPPARTFLDRIRRTEFPMTLGALDLTADEFLLAARNARTIRERITVLDLAAHAGVLEEAAQETLVLLTA